MITQKQKENLLKAIDLAEGFGNCAYISRWGEAKPCCVIAQLATLEGIKISDMEFWRGSSVSGVLLHPKNLGAEALIPYPQSLLSMLQSIWDGGKGDDVKDESEAKDWMRSVVEKETVG